MNVQINLKNISRIIYIVMILAFYIYNTSLPMTLIPIAGHDDGLFIKLARSISRGHWLGDFSQFTLMKGPGLSIILAILYWFKIPLTIFYSVLIISVCEYLRRILQRLLHNYYFSGFISLFIMWYPGMDAIRILREPLLSWLVILAIAMAVSFYIKIQKDNYFDKKQIILIGALLGYICLIREEWSTVITLIMLIPLSVIYLSRNGKLFAINYRNKIVFIFMATIMLPTFLVSSLNLFCYGSYIANDFKEKNFVESLRLLQSIKSSGAVNKGVIPVSKEVRFKLYQLSPAFSELKVFMDVENAPLSGWQKPSCDQYPETCGDYGGGWFFWAFRDAVSAAGYYDSPKSSAKFYERLNNEVRTLCESGKLICENKITAIPNLNNRQIADVFNLIILSFKQIALLNPPDVYNMPSMGGDAALNRAARFLNLSSYYPSANIENFNENSKVKGDLQNKRNASFKIKKILYVFYSKICFAISLIGFVSFLFCLMTLKKPGQYLFLLGVLWTLVLVRVALISVAAEATLATVNHQYLAFAGPILILTSLLSISFALNNFNLSSILNKKL